MNSLCIFKQFKCKSDHVTCLLKSPYWFPTSLGMESKLLNHNFTSFEPSLLPHLTLLDHTILTTSACFLFLRPSFFCFRDLYLLSPLPRRHFFQTSRVHTLTLFKFLSTWNLFGEILLTTLSKIISTLPVVSFSSWSCILSQIYVVSCLLSVYTWL